MSVTASSATGVEQVRLSDADREDAVDLLNRAVATGRISWAEHTDRVARVWGSRTDSELMPCVADLAERPTRRDPQVVNAVLGKIVRGREHGRPLRAHSLFGAVVVRLSELMPGEEVAVEASSFCGKVVLYVEGPAVVVDEGSAVVGKRKVFGGSSGPGLPVVRITGRSAFGHLRVLVG